MPETIRRGREESKSPPLEVLGVFSLAPSATLSFHKENSVIAEGLVLDMLPPSRTLNNETCLGVLSCLGKVK